MGLTEILHEIESLPSADQLVLLERLKELTGHEVPESFRKSMAEAERGELIPLDDALEELDH